MNQPPHGQYPPGQYPPGPGMPGQMPPGPPMGPGMGYPPMGPPPPKKGSAGGTALTVIGALCLCGCLFFGYFSWANAQSARRLSSSIGPRGGGFVVDIVRRKSERQQNYAIVFGVLAVAFIGGGTALKKKAKGAAGPAMHPGMMPPQGMHPGMQQPGMMPPQGMHPGMQQPGMPPQGMQQPGMPPQGGPPGGYPPQGGGGMPQA